MVIIAGFCNPLFSQNTTLSCNDNVQLSLDDNCKGVISLDLVLEGAILPDQCLSFTIKDENGDLVLTNPIINGDHLGQNLLVEVFNNCAGTSCWTYVWVEDHIPVEEPCAPLKLECYDSHFPGDPILSKHTLNHMGEQGVAINIGSELDLNFNVPTVGYNTIHDIELYLYISGKSPGDDHGDLSGISAYLTSPYNSDITLFTEPSACDGVVELKLSLSDDHYYSNDKLDSPEHCDYSPLEAIVGKFQPEDAFSELEGEHAGGIWTLKITNANWPDATYEPKVIKAEATFYIVQDHVYIPGTPSAYYAEYEGNNTFSFPLNGPCQAQSATFVDTYTEGCDNVAWDCVLSPEFMSIDGLTPGDVVSYEGDCWVFTTILVKEPQAGTPDGWNYWQPFQATNFALYGKIERCWTVTDGGGNVTECCQDIYIEKANVDDIVCPHNYDDSDRPAFRCTDYFEELENGAPAPSVTGYPYDRNSREDFLCGNMSSSFDDLIIDLCPNSFKVIRQWTVLDWCTSEVYKCNQIIKVLDDVRPIVDCELYDEVYMDQNPYICGVNYLVPEPNVVSECGDYTWTVEWAYSRVYGECIPPSDYGYYTSEGVTTEEGQVFIQNLPIGCNWIRYIIEDACGNVNYGECRIEVKVIDNIPPIPVCDEHTVVSVSGVGYGHLYAGSIDDGSWDNCGIYYMEVAKMTDVCPPEPDPESDEESEEESDEEEIVFHPYVEFCCAEIGSTVMVALRVWDVNGNSNTCMTEVHVQDKIAPHLDCPEDVTINCFDDYEDLYITGEAYASDNCVDVTVSYIDEKDLGQCGVGRIERTWVAIDGGDLTDSCTQIIDLVNFNPFVVYPEYFPEDKYLTECYSNTTPSVTGDVILPDNECSLVDATYHDQEFEFVEDVCLKIVRTWTVIDWCQYNSTTGEGIWSDIQIIKLNNFNAPEFTSSCDDVTICGYGECEDEITLTAVAEDDCTPVDELEWSYRIDINNDGVFNPQYGGTSSSVTDIYPFGTHRIEWSVEDVCGNITTCEYLFTHDDCKEPTPYCLSSLTTVVMNSNGEVEVWASDFDFGSADNCTRDEDLIFSFSSDIEDTYKIFSCADIPNGQYVGIPLEIWVTDNYGNQDFCDVDIQLQDNEGNACVDVDLQAATVSGAIYTENNDMVEDVQVMVESSQAEFPRSMMTGEDGAYSFEYLFVDNNYDIQASKLDDILNGVSTLDLVMIQRHILGLSTLDSPYKIIAADADNNQKVSALDLINFRKLILGVTDELPNGQESWRFIDSDFTFDNPVNPFPFTEVITINQLNNHLLDQNLIGVKIGDVNGSASANSLHSTEIRSGSSLTLGIDDKEFKTGDLVEIAVTAESFQTITGMQGSFEFDAAGLTFESFEPGLMNISGANFGMHQLEKGLLGFSWNDESLSTVNIDNPLFKLTFKALKDGRLAEVFDLNSALLASEAYTDNLETMSIELRFNGAVEELNSTSLYQNIPNPFTQSTRIGFELANEGDVQIQIFDTKGSLIYERSGWYNKGFQEILIEGGELNFSGVMYYTLQTSDQKITKKMIRIK
jgi:hypothetical protein